MKMNVKTVILIVVIACVVGLAAGMLGYNMGAAKAPEALPVQTQAADNLDYFLIGTQYGSLYYPDYWQGHMVHEVQPQGEALAVVFNASINDKLYPLFTMTIGEGEGTQVGTLTDEAGTARPVYMTVAEILEDGSLTNDELSRLYAMQEDLNFVIDHLK